jgi:hypothetical protein
MVVSQRISVVTVCSRLKICIYLDILDPVCVHDGHGAITKAQPKIAMVPAKQVQGPKAGPIGLKTRDLSIKRMGALPTELLPPFPEMVLHGLDTYTEPMGGVLFRSSPHGWYSGAVGAIVRLSVRRECPVEADDCRGIKAENDACSNFYEGVSSSNPPGCCCYFYVNNALVSVIECTVSGESSKPGHAALPRLLSRQPGVLAR